MDPQIQKIDLDVKERISILPEEITEIVTLGILESVMKEITEQQQLTTTQARILEEHIMLVLVFFLPKTGFKERIQESMEISDSRAASAAKYTENEIFNLVDDILEDVDKSFKDNPKPVTEALPPTPQAPAVEDPVPEEPVVQPLRTMEQDMDRIHGYGAYRKMYPDPEVESAIPDPVAPQATPAVPLTPAPTQTIPQEEKVVVATPQDETLGSQPPLTNTPTYTEEQQK